MTEKLNQEALERAAEAGWQEDSLRAHGRKRLIPWSEVDGRDREKWLGLATAIAAALPLSDSLAERTRERDEARELAYELKYAAAGGEDVPLSAHAVTVADVNRWRVEAQERADAAEARVKALTEAAGQLELALDRRAKLLTPEAYNAAVEGHPEMQSALLAVDQARSALRAALASSDAAPEPMVWHKGEPPKPWRSEWFIAETTYGDRVVLRALPEEYTYDYKTADETFIKADKIKRWMQFPDSGFVPAASSDAAPEPVSDRYKLAVPELLSNPQQLEALAKFQDEAARYFERRDTGGEDKAFWANVANAEMCRKTAEALRAVVSLTVAKSCHGLLEIDHHE